jgi:hypothetical protein
LIADSAKLKVVRHLKGGSWYPDDYSPIKKKGENEIELGKSRRNKDVSQNLDEHTGDNRQCERFHARRYKTVKTTPYPS